jgi:hypothetical protein
VITVKFNIMKHTQGEWKYNVKHRGSAKPSLIQVIIPNNRALELGQISEDDCTVATCCKVEDHANARLIAAAPDLLEALKICYASLSTYGSHPIIEKQVQNAITKATL